MSPGYQKVTERTPLVNGLRLNKGAGSRLVAIGEREFSCGSPRRLAVPDGVERLGDGCFCQCRSLEAVDFGAGSRLVAVEDGVLAQAWLRRVGLEDAGF